MSGIPVWPVAATALGREVDGLFIGLLVTTGLLLLIVFGAIWTYTIRYRRGSKVHRAAAIERTWPYEIGGIAVLLLISFGLFFWGAGLYERLLRPPPDAMDIFVVGKQWMWKVQHAGGQREINELHVPVGRAVRLVMSSEDVIHSFFVPAFRVKHDVVPGRFETVWFQAEKTGDFQLFCAEFCGTSHAAMQGHVIVMTPEDFARWLDTQRVGETMMSAGEGLFRRFGCSGCHAGPATLADAPLVPGTARGPRLERVYGSTVALADGATVTADERYLRDAVLRPNAEVVAGYAPVMPSYAGRVSEDELQKLVAYIKSLATVPAGAPR